MKNMNFEQNEKLVKDILTPKHTPECNIKFESKKEPERPKIIRSIRIATIVAATLACIIFATTKINFVEKVQATPSPMEMISKGFKKLSNVESMYLEFQAMERIKIGLPVKKDNEYANCRHYFLQGDSAVYMREEWDDEYNTVAIYDKDSLYLWQNDKLQMTLKIPLRPARYEYLFNTINNMIHKEEENSYVLVTEKPNNPQPQNNIGNNLAMENFHNISIEEIERIEVIKEEKIIKLETKPATEYEPFYELYYSAEKDEFTKFKIVKQEKGTDERSVLLETTKLVYNYPNTVRKITKKPIER